jgi:hypothetical protein
MSHTRVLFTASDREVARMDIRLGPCVPLQGRKKPLAGRLSQGWPEGPERLATLYEVLSGRPPQEAWSKSTLLRPGRLFVLSDAFVRKLAEIDSARVAAATDEERHEVLEEVARRWRPRVHAPAEWDDRRSQVDVLMAAWDAARAVMKSQRLYAWYGPGLSLWSQEKIKRVAERVVIDQPGRHDRRGGAG